MRVVVVQAYQQPYPNPITVAVGAHVVPEFTRATSIAGWVWCLANDGRAGWTPKRWLVEDAAGWRITRDFNAIELTLAIGERLTVLTEESAFYWARHDDGRQGWVPVECVMPAPDDAQ